MTYKKMENKKIQIVKDYFAAWETGRKKLLDLASNLIFTSPDDSFSSSTDFLSKCWQYHGLKYENMRFISERNVVCVTYEITESDGKRFKNCEWITIENGENSEIIVFYGSK